jgi:putative secretion ATPase (PEP-CTERM system associated)
MYNEFFHLSEPPFSIQPDPSFLYFSKRHSMAMAMLEYGIEHRAGFIAITGEIGCGKTTLIRRLLDRIEDDVTVGLIANTAVQAEELLRWVLLAFDQPYDFDHKVALFDQLQRFLIGEYSAGRRTVLIIDEAQNLKAEVLEELRMLSNINSDKDQLLQLVLVGQPELKDMLRSPELVQFSQRISVDFHITPLNEQETQEYIKHRLSIAGRDADLFDQAAAQMIHVAAKGVPRSINILCDTALIYGFSAQATEITPDIVEEVITDKMEYGIFAPASTSRAEG